MNNQKWHAPPLSSRWMLQWAALLTLGFALAHLLGGRAYAAILTGTVVGSSQTLSALAGMGYLALYWGVVLVCPILVLASLLLSVCNRWWPGGRSKSLPAGRAGVAIGRGRVWNLASL